MFKKILVAGAVTPVPIGEICGDGLGPFAQFFCNLPTPNPNIPDSGKNNAVQALGALAFFVSNIIAIMMVVAGFIFIFQFLIGGYTWLTSSGDKGKLEKAQQTLLQAIIGLVIVLAGYAIISLVAKILGVDILLNDPAGFVDRLKL